MPKAEDGKILADLTKQCADKTAQYEDLKMVRANEEAAVAQAILILNSDAAFESFGATAAETSGNTGFILLRKSPTVRRQVRHLLENLAKETEESYQDEGHGVPGAPPHRAPRRWARTHAAAANSRTGPRRRSCSRRTCIL